MALGDDIKVWPLFYQHTDPEARTRRTEVLWPLYVREAGHDYSANQFISFPQDYPEVYPHQFYVLWPFSGVRAGNGHDAWLFPFLWSRSESARNNHHFALFPAFYYGENGDATTLNIGLLQHNHWNQYGSAHYLWPLFWNSEWRRVDSSSRDVGLLPVFWMSRHQTDSPACLSGGRRGGALILGWWGRRSVTHRSGGVITRTWEESGETVFPVYRRTVQRSADRRSSLDSAEDSLWVIPYHERHESGTNPSGAYAESSHTFLPIYHDWEKSHAAKRRSGKLVLPFWLHAEAFEGDVRTESADFVVPIGARLYKKDEYETRNLMGPVFNRTADLKNRSVRYDALFPFFQLTVGDDESAGRVFPFAGWDEKDGERDNLWWLFPLGWNTEEQGRIHYSSIYPELAAWREPDSQECRTATDCHSGPRRTLAFYPLFWSHREADVQKSGLLPLYWRNIYRHGRTVSHDTTIPLTLGNRQTQVKDGVRTHAERNYLLSILSFGMGEDYRRWRAFPVFSYRRSGGSRDYSSFIVPFAYDTWRDPEQPEQSFSTDLSVPFSFLPLYHTRERQDSGTGTNRASWFFPLYKRSFTDSAEGQTTKLSILWPLWNGEWRNNETHIRGLGGVVNFYEKDANDFVEQRLLYRIFSRRTRSWISERELMPLYAQQRREDGRSSWSVLGGLLGAGNDGERHYLRLLYFKVPTSAVRAKAEGGTAERERRHAELALNYLRHDRHDRAAIEFALAGATFQGDRDMQAAAGEAYLKAQPDALGKELRSSVPAPLDPLVGGAGRNQAAVRTHLRRQAIHHFEAAIRLGADKPSILLNVAKAHVELDELENALEDLAESDRLRPSWATGMERLGVGEDLWRRRVSRKDPEAEIRAAREALLSLLNALKQRYPASPTLALREAAWIGGERPEDAYCRMFGGPPPGKAFAPETLRRLEIYRQAVDWTPGPEEQEWVAGLRTTSCSPSFIGVWNSVERGNVPPQVLCARRAVEIINRQLGELVDNRKYDEAVALRQPLFDLLARTCLRCVKPGGEKPGYADAELLAAPLRQLREVYVDRWKKPELYLEAVEGLSSALCAHQGAAVERVLDSLRLEQQYIKTWRLAGVINGRPVECEYAGGFFDRYVDLDKILGQPDRCTVTAECVIQVPAGRPAVLRLGFDRTLTVELNGDVVFGPASSKIAVRDDYTVPVTLKSGENRLRLTITDDTMAYGFFARLSSPGGDWMKDVRWTR